MKITGYNLDQLFTFSRNAFPITISEIESTSITVTVSFQGATYEMTLSPDSSKTVKLDLQGILRSLAPKIDAVENIYNHIFTPISSNNTVSISASGSADDEVSASLVAIDGGVDGSPDLDYFENGIWLTWKPESALTYKDSYEPLSMLIQTLAVPDLTDGALFRHRTLAKVYLKTGEEAVIELSDGILNQAAGLYLLRVNASLSRVADVLSSDPDHTEYDIDDIVAYDVYGEFCRPNDEVLMTGTPPVQRFVVVPSRRNFKCFVFRNRLGVADSVFSTGAHTRILTPDVATFITGRTESELTNKSRESFKVNTGLLDSTLMVNQWQDFFLSDERYLYEDGTLKRIIIEEGKSEAKLQSLNDMEFTYHLSEQPAGRFREKKTLNSFNYE